MSESKSKSKSSAKKRTVSAKQKASSAKQKMSKKDRTVLENRKAKSIKAVIEVLPNKQKVLALKKWPTLKTADERIRFVNSFNKKSRSMLAEDIPCPVLTAPGIDSLVVELNKEISSSKKA